MARRINKAIELLDAGQPLYYISSHNRFDVSYDAGREQAQTWGDYIIVEMEHGAYDMPALAEFMRGLADGGPTASGHRTPAVIVELPVDGSSEAVIRANAWQFRQALARGVHGILLCHAEHPAAVRAFVESCRYPFYPAAEGLGEGLRGSAGQDPAAAAWGVGVSEYLEKADVWPLNPKGELLLGIKIENRRALDRCEASLAVPGIGFAEWGPGDMGFSFGHPERHDPPYPPEMLAARERVRAACLANGVRFQDLVNRENVIEQLAQGVMIGSPQNGDEETVRMGRAHTGRIMPV